MSRSLWFLTFVIGIFSCYALGLVVTIYSHSPLQATQLSNVDVIVLLAGSYEDRSLQVIDLYYSGHAGHILLTDDNVRRGWSKEHQRNLYSIERTKELLFSHGIPQTAVSCLPFYRSGTIYDAFAVRNYIIAHGTKSILLVTSDHHAKRALWLFKQVLRGLPVTVSISSVPTKLSLQALLEPVKFIYYYLRVGLLSDFFGYPKQESMT